MRAFCIKCGTEQFDDAVFCHVCGASVRRATEPSAQSVATAPAPQSAPQPVPQSTPQPQPVAEPVYQPAPQADPWASGWTQSTFPGEPASQPAPPPQPKPVTLPPFLKNLLKRRLSKPVTLAQRLTSCLLVLIIVCATFVAISSIQYVENTSKSQIRQSVEQAMGQTDLSELPADEFAPFADPSLSVTEWFAQEVGGCFSPSVVIKSSKVEKFFDSADMDHFIADNISDMLENVEDNRRHNGLYTDMVLDYFEENELALYNLAGTTSTTLTTARISDHLNSSGLFGQLGASTMREENPALYFTLQFLTMSETLTLAMWLILISVILLLVNYRCNIFRTLFDAGLALIIPGGLFLLLSFFYQTFPTSWCDLFGFFQGHIAGDIIIQGQDLYLLLCLTSVAMMVIHGVWHNGQKKLVKHLSQPAEEEIAEAVTE